MASQSLEDRLAALENEVTRLRALVEQKHGPKDWRKVVGVFLNDPYFEAAMKEGRRYRESTRPRKKNQRKKPHGHP